MVDAKPGVVTAVLGPRRLNVSAGKSDYDNLPCHEDYGRVAQVGDPVMLLQLSEAQWVVAMYLGDQNRLYIPPQPKVPTVTVQGTAPTGMTQITGTYVSQETYSNPASLVYVWGTAPPTPAAPGTVLSFAPLTSGTYDDYYTGWRTDDDKVRQAGGGNARGLWFYGNTITAGLASVTPAKIQLTVTRSSEYHGYPSPYLAVRLHNHGSQPAGVPVFTEAFTGPTIGRGETTTFDLPVSWASQIKAGTAAGVGLWTGSPDDLQNVYALGASSDVSGLITITTT